MSTGQIPVARRGVTWANHAMNDGDLSDPFVIGLRAIMERRGERPAPLAVRAGLSDSAIRDLFRKGASPKLSTALALAGALGASIDEVIAAGHRPRRVDLGAVAPDSSRLIPVYDVGASAGSGAFVEAEAHIHNLAFDSAFLRLMTDAAARDLCIIKVQGHSMEPTLIDGDQVLVDRSKTNLSFDGLFVIRFDDALHVKRVGRSTNAGHVLVISDHPSYPTLDMAKSDLHPIGRVLWYGRRV